MQYTHFLSAHFIVFELCIGNPFAVKAQHGLDWLQNAVHSSQDCIQHFFFLLLCVQKSETVSRYTESWKLWVESA